MIVSSNGYVQTEREHSFWRCTGGLDQMRQAETMVQTGYGDRVQSDTDAE